MKYRLLFFFSFLSFFLPAQNSFFFLDSAYIDASGSTCAKEDAVLFRVGFKDGEGFILKDFSMSTNQLKMLYVSNSLNDKQKNGACTRYYENGEKESEGSYVDDKRDGKWMEWFENGQKQSEIIYKKGKISGSSVNWYENGQKKSEGNYVDSKQEGIHTEWYENGQKQNQGKYIDGKQDGIWILWDEDHKDSTVVTCFPDATYKNIHLSARETTVNRKYKKRYPIFHMAQFKGGEKKMAKFISKNIIYPVAEKEAGLEGTCYATFVVEKDGKISDVRLLKGIPKAPGYNAETLRVIKTMPQWEPGMMYGKSVRVQFNLPIKYSLR